MSAVTWLSTTEGVLSVKHVDYHLFGLYEVTECY